MTIANENSLVTHNGNGVTTEWPYTFPIPDADFARVGLFEIASSTLTLLDAVDYSISGIDNPAGGEVVYPLVGDPIESTHRLVIWRELPYHQDTQLTNQTPYYSVVLEAQLDRIVMQIQQIAEETGRAVKVTQGSTSTPDELLEDISAAVTAAGNSASAAAISAGTATTKAGEAEASAILAQEWASADEDVLVDATDYSAKHYSIKSAASALAAAEAAASIVVPSAWEVQPIGVPIPIMDNITGVDEPPTDKSYRYIKLTASDAYNSGVLTGESVSGSSPDITATAVVSLTGSPIDGQTVPLINTDRRFLRAGSAGTKEQSQNKSHSHTGSTNTTGAHAHTVPARSAGSGGSSFDRVDAQYGTTTGANGNVSTSSTGNHSHTLTIDASGDTEARPANLGVTYYMRIK